MLKCALQAWTNLENTPNADKWNGKMHRDTKQSLLIRSDDVAFQLAIFDCLKASCFSAFSPSQPDVTPSRRGGQMSSPTRTHIYSRMWPIEAYARTHAKLLNVAHKVDSILRKLAAVITYDPRGGESARQTT